MPIYMKAPFNVSWLAHTQYVVVCPHLLWPTAPFMHNTYGLRVVVIARYVSIKQHVIFTCGCSMISIVSAVHKTHIPFSHYIACRMRDWIVQWVTTQWHSLITFIVYLELRQSHICSTKHLKFKSSANVIVETDLRASAVLMLEKMKAPQYNQ